ncbi:bile acid:sodium symporter family protein, partial [Peterkaempfera griseoplana]|uniref:bile acid:sodium symporter family protein n=1 Tax=Peterkaempfera griseoplana TaxID=66896 RepID=UPI0006E1379E
MPRPFADRPRSPRLPRVDPYIAALLGTVLLATLLPARGSAAHAAGDATTVAVGVLFFLYGARMSTRDAWEGVRHWRLHLLVLLFTFVLFPLLGLALRPAAGWLLGAPTATGLLFLCLLPSTVQSSIAFTSIAGGNVPAAVCAGSFSNLLGVLVTPLSAAWLLGTAGGGLSADSLLSIGEQLLLPFVAGQVLRRWIGGWVGRHRRVLGLVDRGSILLVVYTAFSEGVVAGIWHDMPVPRLLGLLVVEAALLAVVLAV